MHNTLSFQPAMDYTYHGGSEIEKELKSSYVQLCPGVWVTRLRAATTLKWPVPSGKRFYNLKKSFTFLENHFQVSHPTPPAMKFHDYFLPNQEPLFLV